MYAQKDRIKEYDRGLCTGASDSLVPRPAPFQNMFQSTPTTMELWNEESQLSLRRTPLGPTISVRLEEVSVLRTVKL